MGPGNGFEQGAVEGGEAPRAKAFHLGEDGCRIPPQLGYIHALAVIWSCA
jgi:hypothetical protein